MFQGGVIKVQCVATLFNLYKRENVQYLEDGRPQPWPSSVIGSAAGSASERQSIKVNDNFINIY